MREAWTGKFVGDMHLYEVTRAELAEELGFARPYISQVLNGARTPGGAEKKFRAALDAIIARKKSDNQG